MKQIEFSFTNEELLYRWRKQKALPSTFNHISTELDHWQQNLLTDTPTESYIPYRNGVVKVTRKGRELLPYKNINFQIWKERILRRDFKYTQEVGMFEQFFGNVFGEGETRKEQTKSKSYKRALWYFGYMLHANKRLSMARALILYDIKAGKNGRTGKTIIGTAISKIRNTAIIEGKKLDLTNRFAFQKVTPWTEVIFIDDPKKEMDLDLLFNMITGTSEAERKGKDPISTNAKLMIATNWVLSAEGTSETGRQFVAQVNDFYVRYAKANGNTLQPLVHRHGKEFFTEWDEHDWSQFDSFCVRALQYYFGNDVPQDTIIGNSKIIRFIQQHGEDLFYELVVTFQNRKQEKDGRVSIGKSDLASVINLHNEFNSTETGRIAKDFLRSIGAGEIRNSTTSNGSSVPQTVYQITAKIEDLNLNYGQHDTTKDESRRKLLPRKAVKVNQSER